MKRELLQLLLAQLSVAPKAVEAWGWKEDGSRPAMQRGAPASGEVLLYGLIVPQSMVAFYRGWFGDDSVVSGQMFRELLAEVAGPLTIRINSPGGDVWECASMIQAIQERREKTSAVIDGIAASAASLIAAACDDVTISQMGEVMIHRASATWHGTAVDMRRVANSLESTDQQAVDIYARRLKPDKKGILDLMTEETYWGAAEAVEVGFADRVFEPAPRDDEDPDLPAAADMAALRDRRFAAFAATL